MENVDDIYPLTSLQRGMLFHSVASPGSGVYVEQITARIDDSDLDVQRFRDAWKLLVERHPALRTLYLWEDLPEPLQVVRSEVEIPWRMEDYADMAPEQAEEQLQSILGQDQAQDFELGSAPLMRMTLVNLGHDSYWWLWSRHHLLADGWSTSVLLEELAAIYQSPDSQALAPAAPYRYLISYLKARESDSDSDTEFWKGLLAGFSAKNQLLVGEVRSSQHEAGSYGQREVTLNQRDSDRLRQLAREHKVTLNVVMQFCWAFMLSRYSNDRDVLWGSTFSGRSGEIEGKEGIVGLFINTLPLRLNLDPAETAAFHLKTLQELFLQVLAREHCGLEDIQKIADIPFGTGLFDSVVVFENYPRKQNRPNGGGAGELHLSELEYRERSNLPLALIVLPSEDIDLILIYDESLYSKVIIDRMLQQMSQLLAMLPDVIDLPVGQVPIISKIELEKIHGWNNTDVDYRETRSIDRVIDELADSQPESPAIVFGSKQVTYGQLKYHSDHLALKLAEMVGKSNAPVALSVTRGWELIVWILAVLKSGNHYLVIDPEYPLPRQQLMLDLGNACALVTDNREGFPVGIPVLGHEIPLGETRSADSDSAALLAGIDRSDDDPAYLIFTSGSTGQPKGVTVTHRNLRHSTLARLSAYPCRPESFLHVSSFSFDSSVVGLYWTLACGGKLVISEPKMEQDVAQLASTMEREKITHVLGLPSLLAVLVESLDEEQCRGLALNTVISAGESLNNGDFIRRFYDVFPDASLYNEYGPTEASVWCTTHRVLPADAGRAVPVGKPIANTRIWILDDNSQLCPIGMPGEIVISGMGVTEGYLNQSGETGLSFRRHPTLIENNPLCYHTGDLGRMRENGEVECLGRIDDQLKVRGYRIDPNEVTQALLEIQGVREAATLGVASISSSRQLVSFVTGASIEDVGSIREKLEQVLPAHLVPSRIVALPELPRLANGKVDAAALEQIALDQRVSLSKNPGDTESLTGDQRVLLDVLQEVLGVAQVGLDDNYFDLGGDSIHSIRVISKLRQAGYTLGVNEIFEFPEIVALSSRLVAGSDVSTPENGAGVERDLDLESASFALSDTQLSFLFAHLQHRDRDPGHMQIQCRLTGDFDPERFKRAWLDVSRVHPMLGARVEWGSDQTPLQRLEAVGQFDYRYIRLGNEDSSGEIERYLVDDRANPINLEEAPCWRVAVLGVSETDNVLIWSGHHMFIDGWSASRIIRDVVSGYNDSKPARGATPLFASYIKYLQERDCDEARAFWFAKSYTVKQQLEDAREINPQSGDLRSASIDLPLGKSELQSESSPWVADLQSLCRNSGITMAHLFQAAWAACLSKIASVNQVEFFITLSGRNIGLPGIENTAGQFVTHLPMLVDLDPGWSFNDLIAETRRVAVDLLKHEHVSLNQIEDWYPQKFGTYLNIQGNGYLMPTLLMVENFDWKLDSVTSGDLEISSFQRQGINPYYSETGIVSLFPLNLVVVPAGNTISVTLYFDPGLVEERQAGACLSELWKILKHWVADPRNPVPFTDVVSPFLDTQALRPVTVAPETHRAYPESPLERQLLSIWEVVLKTGDIDIHRSFFDLGGNSILAVSMLRMVQNQLGLDAPLSILVRHNTIADLAAALGRGETFDFKTLVEIQRGKDLPPVFGIHAEGNVLFYRDFAFALGDEQPFYGLQSRELSGEAYSFSSIQEMAEEYIREIKSVQPDGPYTICGMCFGAWIAFEMARQLTIAGEKVGRLIIFDSGGPRRSKSSPGKARKWFWENPKLVNIIHSLSRLTLDGEAKRIKKAAQHHRYLKKNYQPQVYEGGILFLRSEEFENDQKLRRHVAYWDEICEQGVESHLVPGGHGNILQAPQVFEAARIVKETLNS